MAEYIERETAIDSLLGWAAQLTETYGKNDEYVRCLESAAYNIEQIPAADVQPVVRARWITPPKNRDYAHMPDFYECPLCGYIEDCSVNFCPNCGADMREES